MFRVEVVTEEIDFKAAMLENLAAKVPKNQRAVFDVGETRFNLITGAETIAWAVLPELPLHTHFEVGPDKILRPLFASSSDSEDALSDHPKINARWRCDRFNIRLVFAVRMTAVEGYYQIPSRDGCYLFAFSGNDRKCYLLPLPNLYDHGALCMGSFNGTMLAIAGCVKAALEQLEKSQWNTDLLDATKTKKCQDMFQFRVTDDSLDTVFPDDADKWKAALNTIATPISNLIGGFLL